MSKGMRVWNERPEIIYGSIGWLFLSTQIVFLLPWRHGEPSAAKPKPRISHGFTDWARIK